MTQRQKDTGKTQGTKANDISYNEQAGGLKVVGPIVGCLHRLLEGMSDSSFPAPFRNGGVVAFYNPTAATEWITVSTSTAAPVAPSSLTGIALKPNDYTILAMPDGATKVSASNAAIIAYLVKDDSKIG